MRQSDIIVLRGLLQCGGTVVAVTSGAQRRLKERKFTLIRTCGSNTLSGSTDQCQIILQSTRPVELQHNTGRPGRKFCEFPNGNFVLLFVHTGAHLQWVQANESVWLHKPSARRVTRRTKNLKSEAFEPKPIPSCQTVLFVLPAAMFTQEFHCKDPS